MQSLGNNLKNLISIILPVSQMFSFQKCVAHKQESCVYFITFLYIHLFPCENSLDWITTCVFFKTRN